MSKKGEKQTESSPSDDTVRLNLVILESEQDKIVEFQGKFRRPQRLFNKSEVLRAGIYALTILNAKQLKEVSDSVPQL